MDLGATKTEGSYKEVYINEILYKALYNYKNKQNLLRKKYGSRYKKYCLEDIKNKYGKIVEYKIIESKYKRKDNIDMVFTRKDGTYSDGQDRQHTRDPRGIESHFLGKESGGSARDRDLLYRR